MRPCRFCTFLQGLSLQCLERKARNALSEAAKKDEKCDSVSKEAVQPKPLSEEASCSKTFREAFWTFSLRPAKEVPTTPHDLVQQQVWKASQVWTVNFSAVSESDGEKFGCLHLAHIPTVVIVVAACSPSTKFRHRRQL